MYRLGPVVEHVVLSM